jgi:hypothetical protein
MEPRETRGITLAIAICFLDDYQPQMSRSFEVLRDWLDLPPARIAALRAGGAVT